MNVPKLRFKDDGVHYSDWQEGNLLELSESGFTNGIFNDPAKVGRGYKLINVLDMYIESTIDEKRLFLVELSESEFEKNKAEYGDIFFTRSSLVKEGIAFSNVYLGRSQDVTFDGHLIKMSPRKDLINPIFFNYVLRTSKVRKQLVMRGKTATMTTIGQADIATVNVLFPLLPEQTKIANFLTAIDEKITQLTQKHGLLKQYKKGVMQQIFSQKLRFKDDDGREFPEWEETTLGEATELFSRRNKNLIDAEVYSVTNSNGFVLQSEHFEDRVIAGSDLSNYKIIYQGEFAYNPARVNVGSIALFTEQVGVISSLYVCFKCKPSVDNTFLLNYLELDSTKQNINSFGEGGVRIYLWYPLFSQIPISLPSLKEQTKIANFLTAIDDKITHIKTQLDAVKLYKKGLLQQMFV